MPHYLDHDVSDDYLQGLIEAYRDGYKAGDGDEEADQGDQAIIDRLTQEKIRTQPGAKELGFRDAEALNDSIPSTN